MVVSFYLHFSSVTVAAAVVRPFLSDSGMFCLLCRTQFLLLSVSCPNWSWRLYAVRQVSPIASIPPHTPKSVKWDNASGLRDHKECWVLWNRLIDCNRFVACILSSHNQVAYCGIYMLVRLCEKNIDSCMVIKWRWNVMVVRRFIDNSAQCLYVASQIFETSLIYFFEEIHWWNLNSFLNFLLAKQNKSLSKQLHRWAIFYALNISESWMLNLYLAFGLLAKLGSPIKSRNIRTNPKKVLIYFVLKCFFSSWFPLSVHPNYTCGTKDDKKRAKLIEWVRCNIKGNSERCYLADRQDIMLSIIISSPRHPTNNLI